MVNYTRFVRALARPVPIGLGSWRQIASQHTLCRRKGVIVPVNNQTGRHLCARMREKSSTFRPVQSQLLHLFLDK